MFREGFLEKVTLGLTLEGSVYVCQINEVGWELQAESLQRSVSSTALLMMCKGFGRQMMIPTRAQTPS